MKLVADQLCQGYPSLKRKEYPFDQLFPGGRDRHLFRKKVGAVLDFVDARSNDAIVVSTEGLLAGQQVEQHDPNRPDITGRADRPLASQHNREHPKKHRPEQPRSAGEQLDPQPGLQH